jgi:hypothetical protein
MVVFRYLIFCLGDDADCEAKNFDGQDLQDLQTVDHRGATEEPYFLESLG